MTKRKILIVYERKNREYESCVILKEYLTCRGCDVTITQFLESKNFNFFLRKKYDAILVSSLYTTDSLNRILVRFGRPLAVVNLQLEQVLSNKWETHGFHNPSNDAKKGVHICWGPRTKNRLMQAGVPDENCPVTGAIQLDFLRPELCQTQEEMRSAVSSQYNLPIDETWTLFLSSFTYADISDQRLLMNENIVGTNLESFRKTHTKARDGIIQWFEKILLEDTKTVFVYRPHPDELNLEKVQDLAKRFDNFHIISSDAAKTWIIACDRLYTWYSTTIVEAQFLDRSCLILRPTELDENFESVLFEAGKFVTTYEEFQLAHFAGSSTRQFSIPEDHIWQYYLNTEYPAFFNIANIIFDAIARQPLKKHKVTLSQYLKNYSKMIVIHILNIVLKSRIISIKSKNLGFNQNFLHRWLIEMDNQFVSSEEQKKFTENIRPKIKKWNAEQNKRTP